MPTWLRSGLTQAVALGGVGLAAGLVAAWVGLLAADGAAAVAAVSASLYPALAAALPLALLALNWRGAPGGAALLGGALGGALAHLCFVVACTNLPATFGGESAVEMSRAIQPAIGWARPGIVVAATLISALILAMRARTA